MKTIGKQLASFEQACLPRSDGPMPFEEFKSGYLLCQKWGDAKTKPPFVTAEIRKFLNRIAKTQQSAKEPSGDAHHP